MTSADTNLLFSLSVVVLVYAVLKNLSSIKTLGLNNYLFWNLSEIKGQITVFSSQVVTADEKITDLQEQLAESNIITVESEEQAAENKYRQPDYPLASTAPAVVLEGGILQNPYSSLSVPTQINKIGEDYFGWIAIITRF